MRFPRTASQTSNAGRSPDCIGSPTPARWAESHGYTLAPAFAYRESRSMIDDETRKVTVVPLVTLAVYEGDRFEAVYPHADGDRVWTVGDDIETLEVMAPPSDDRSDDPAHERDPSENRGERLLVASGR